MGGTPSFLLRIFDQEIKLVELIINRDEFKNFVNTIEHKRLFKEKILYFKTSEDLIILARKHGLSITLEDLNYDKIVSKFEFWIN
tara:strand:- start:185 stop:439 length:255 start_codon:yes stop_codon:yes gene_type:complete